MLISSLFRGNSKEIVPGETVPGKAVPGETVSHTEEEEVDRNIPQPELEPEDVVRLQVNSVREAVHDTAKLKVCYSLASPDNRNATGPFLRFAKSVMLPPYDRLAMSSDWQLGKTMVDGDVAVVLVSTISNQGDVSGFRFLLRRQDFPRPNCWLTEAVVLLLDELDGGSVLSDAGQGRKIE